jgi:hypothetical protein
VKVQKKPPYGRLPGCRVRPFDLRAARVERVELGARDEDRVLADLDVAGCVRAAHVLAQERAVVFVEDLDVEHETLEHGVAVFHRDPGLTHRAFLEHHLTHRQAMPRHRRHVFLHVNVTNARHRLRRVVIIHADGLHRTDLLAVVGNDDPVTGAGFDVRLHLPVLRYAVAEPLNGTAKTVTGT